METVFVELSRFGFPCSLAGICLHDIVLERLSGCSQAKYQIEFRFNRNFQFHRTSIGELLVGRSVSILIAKPEKSDLSLRRQE